MMSGTPLYLNMLAVLTQIAFIAFITFIIVTKRSGLMFQGCPGELSAPKWILAFAVIALVAAIFVGVRRSTYLPFLGCTAFPPRALKVDTDVENKKKSIRVALPMPDATADALVVYWAASSSEVPYPTADVAYLNSENVGVTTVKDGIAIMHLNCPAEYMVNGVTQKRHIHFRVQSKPGSGMFGPVQTVPINCST